ncbi:MAG TPA: flagellar basal body rod protein FlgC [Syntrophobacteraceae bacterium]|nr:flagellar basal body rod protein FlgC [Syntrophobacteraceae bacterium]
MDFGSAMKISASGLTAHRTWMNVLSSNLANAHVTKTEAGTPYERKTVIYESVPFAEQLIESLDEVPGEELERVEVREVVSDRREFKKIHDPSHPDADDQGVVQMPNINPIEEMANLLMASRSYEANLAALNTAKQMALKAMDIGK